MTSQPPALSQLLRMMATFYLNLTFQVTRTRTKDPLLNAVNELWTELSRASLTGVRLLKWMKNWLYNCCERVNILLTYIYPSSVAAKWAYPKELADVCFNELSFFWEYREEDTT